MEEYYYRLTREYFEKTISEEGLNDLKEWVDLHPANQAAFTETLQILEASVSYLNSPDRSDRTWKIISRRTAEPAFIRRIRPERTVYARWIACAALMLMCLSVIVLLKDAGHKAVPTDITEIYNPNGKRSKLLLPDSSVVYLNAGSRLSYNTGFNGEKARRVSLEGEAFFEVVHNKDRPFIVGSRSVTTTVLGTSFNVKAYKDEQVVAVTVSSGKVGVAVRENGSDKFLQYLLPDQQLAVNTTNGDYAFRNLDAPEASSWKDDRIIFSNASLEQIGASLGRWYNIKVIFTRPDQTGCRFTAKFDYIPLDQLADIMAQLTGYTWSVTTGRLIINNEKCGEEVL